MPEESRRDRDLNPLDRHRDRDLNPRDRDRDRDLNPRDRDRDRDLNPRDRDRDRDHENVVSNGLETETWFRDLTSLPRGVARGRQGGAEAHGRRGEEEQKWQTKNERRGKKKKKKKKKQNKKKVITCFGGENFFEGRQFECLPPGARIPSYASVPA